MARSKKTDTAKHNGCCSNSRSKRQPKTASAGPPEGHTCPQNCQHQLAVRRHGMDNRCSDRTCSCGMGRRARTEKDCRKGY